MFLTSDYQRILSRILALGALMTALSACSKTVQWEEEVPLNTGETIWVKRSVEYAFKGGGDNPVDVAYRPNWKERLEFTWRDRQYVYEGEALVFVLAISSKNQPTLVARASDKNWEVNNKYRCTKPSYVQMIPSVDGRTWSWPPAIEPWLYGLPANLMLRRGKPEEMKKRYLTQDQASEDAIVRAQSPSLARIDPTFIFTQDCKGEI